MLLERFKIPISNNGVVVFHDLILPLDDDDLVATRGIGASSIGDERIVKLVMQVSAIRLLSVYEDVISRIQTIEVEPEGHGLLVS